MEIRVLNEAISLFNLEQRHMVTRGMQDNAQ